MSDSEVNKTYIIKLLLREKGILGESKSNLECAKTLPQRDDPTLGGLQAIRVKIKHKGVREGADFQPQLFNRGLDELCKGRCFV